MNMHEIRPFAFPKPYETGHHSCEISARIGYTSTIILYIFWLVVSNLFFHIIWDNPSHWLSYFSRWLKPTTNQYCSCLYPNIFRQILSLSADLTPYRDALLNRDALSVKGDSTDGSVGGQRWDSGKGPEFGLHGEGSLRVSLAIWCQLSVSSGRRQGHSSTVRRHRAFSVKSWSPRKKERRLPNARVSLGEAKEEVWPKIVEILQPQQPHMYSTYMCFTSH